MLRRSLPPILCLVLSLFRLFRTLLPICPTGSSALAIKFLRKAARSASYIPSRLFVSPRNPERAMSRNAISFSLRQLITGGGAVSSSRPLELMTFMALLRPSIFTVISLYHIMQIATWRSIRVFASRYLKEDSSAQDDIRRFGPLGFAGDRMHSRPPQHNH